MTKNEKEKRRKNNIIEAFEICDLMEMMENIMAKIDDVNTAVAANKVAIDAAVVMLESLKGQVGTGATDVQLQAVIDSLTAQVASLNAAVAPVVTPVV